MAEIRFDTGIKEFDINGAVKVQFCPTDMSFIEKVFNVGDAIDKKSEEFQARIDKIEDNRELFDEARAIDGEIRDLLNSIFDEDVCTPLFGTMSTFSAAEGLPVWANFLFAIIDTLDGDFAEQKKKTNQRLQKYTAKYKRR